MMDLKVAGSIPARIAKNELRIEEHLTQHIRMTEWDYIQIPTNVIPNNRPQAYRSNKVSENLY